MRSYTKKMILSVFLGLFLFLTFQIQAFAALWTLDEDSSASGNVITLTESTTCAVGGCYKNIPIDTRYGFTLSFEYCLSDGKSSYTSGPREGLQFILVNQPFTANDYYNLGYGSYIYNGIEGNREAEFCGIEIHRRNHIATVANEGDDRVHLTYASDVPLDEDVWYRIKAVYQNRILKVYQDGELILTCTKFKPSDLAYVGFTASTSYDARQKHQIRNVSLSCEEVTQIHLNANGGTCEESSTYAIPNVTNYLPQPERDGYDFAGWYTSPSGGIKITNGNYSFTSGITIYAQWIPHQHTVELKPGSGTCSTSEVTVSYGSPYSKLPTPKRTGYNFDGWHTKSYGGDLITNFTIVKTDYNHTLYAHWTIKTLTVNFNPNKGKLSSSKKTKLVTYDHTLGELPKPTRKGYIFLGWYTKKSGGSRIKESREIRTNATYYAHWAKNSKKVKIKLNKNKGNCSKSSITVTYGGKLKGLPKASRNGYKFLGWYTEKSGGTKVTASTKTAKVVSATKTLYAHWKKNSSGSSSSSSSSSSSTGSNKFVPDCVFCGGDGDCSNCGGDGKVYSFALDDNDQINCHKCSGTGNCSFCHGSGKRY